MAELAKIISEFGTSAKGKLANAAVTGAPEDQLRAPLEKLVTQVAELAGHQSNAVKLVGETTLAHLSSRPDYAVSVRNALAGFIEVKAPGKGYDPRRFTDVDAIAALAGVGRTTVQTTMHAARRLVHLRIIERPQRGRKSLTNVVTVIDPKLARWISRKRASPK